MKPKRIIKINCDHKTRTAYIEISRLVWKTGAYHVEHYIKHDGASTDRICKLLQKAEYIPYQGIYLI